VTLTATQKRNCAKLASYLETLPEGYEHFAMDCFYGDDNLATVSGYNVCGTVACAIGHGPAAGVKVGRDDRLRSGAILWWSYSDRFATPHTPAWLFMFDGEWAEVDNTPQGAAQRIRWILDGNDPLGVGDLSYKQVPA